MPAFLWMPFLAEYHLMTLALVLFVLAITVIAVLIFTSKYNPTFASESSRLRRDGYTILFIGFLFILILAVSSTVVSADISLPCIIGLIGLVTFFTILIGGNLLSDHDELDTGEVRRAITVSIIVVFFAFLVCGNALQSQMQGGGDQNNTLYSAALNGTKIELTIENIIERNASASPQYLIRNTSTNHTTSSWEGQPSIMETLMNNFWIIVITVIGFYFGGRAFETIAESKAGGKGEPQKAGKTLSALVVVCARSNNCKDQNYKISAHRLRYGYRIDKILEARAPDASNGGDQVCTNGLEFEITLHGLEEAVEIALLEIGQKSGPVSSQTITYGDLETLPSKLKKQPDKNGEWNSLSHDHCTLKIYMRMQGD